MNNINQYFYNTSDETEQKRTIIVNK